MRSGASAGVRVSDAAVSSEASTTQDQPSAPSEARSAIKQITAARA